jgi:hypothetical protein
VTASAGGATLTTAMATDRTYMINPFEWSIIGADAVAETSLASGSSFSCLKQGARLPSGPMSPDGVQVGREGGVGGRPVARCTVARLMKAASTSKVPQP